MNSSLDPICRRRTTLADQWVKNQRVCLPLVVLGIAWLFWTAVPAQLKDYDYRLFSVKEVNDLRQSPPHERIKIFQKVIQRYLNDFTNSIRMRNYGQMGTICDQLEQVMEYVVEDIRLCAADPKNIKRRLFREFEIYLRTQIATLKGQQNALPLQYIEKPEPVIRKLSYARKLLFDLVNPL